MRDFWGNLFGVLILPFVAAAFIVISPFLLIAMYVNYRRSEK